MSPQIFYLQHLVSCYCCICFFSDVLELSMSPVVSSPTPEPTNDELFSFVKQGNFVYFIFLVGLICEV